jgi:ABC-type multidrug transport system ATPase subunit
MLEIINLTKIYDDGTVALKNVSFTVPDGNSWW